MIVLLHRNESALAVVPVRSLSSNVSKYELAITDPVADLGGVRGVQMHPPLVASNVFCVHNCTSPSNDYAAVATKHSYILTYQFLTDLQAFD